MQIAYFIGIGASIRIGQEIRCLPYTGFLLMTKQSLTKTLPQPYEISFVHIHIFVPTLECPISILGQNSPKYT